MTHDTTPTTTAPVPPVTGMMLADEYGWEPDHVAAIISVLGGPDQPVREADVRRCIELAMEHGEPGAEVMCAIGAAVLIGKEAS